MKKVFISLPMANKSEEEIKEELNKRKTALERLSFEVPDTYIENSPNVENIALWCLGESLEIMANCDIAYFCKGWQEARGCLIEYEAAVQYGLQVITEE